MERLFGTLQGRWPQEFRLKGVGTVAAANRCPAEALIPEHDARFAIKATLDGSAFVPCAGRDLADTLRVQEERRVGNDNTVRYRGLVLQIPPSPLRHHFVKATVRVHESPDGRLGLFHGPRCIGRYGADGTAEAHAQAAA